jgi:glycerate 2-kinase
MGKTFRLHLHTIKSALSRAEPRALFLTHCTRDKNTLWLQEQPLDLSGYGLVVALGKAAGPMLQGAQELLRDLPVEWLCVTKDHHLAPPKAKTLFAGHPVPDERSVTAAEELLQRANALGPNDWLLLLLSGGASALACAPTDGVTLLDKRALTSTLLAADLDIRRCNVVRRALSRFKGGGLLQSTNARSVAVVLSDVIQGDLYDVGSGPLSTPASPKAAKEILQEAKLWELTPTTIQTYLENAAEPGPLLPAPHVLLGDRRLLIEGAQTALEGAGVSCEVLSGAFAESAEVLVAQFSARLSTIKPNSALLLTGEPTLSVRGQGLGGRAQHTALRIAKLLQGRAEFSFSAVGSDGTDGPTQSAGAIIDGDTWQRCREAGIDPEEALSKFDSHPAHLAAGSLLTLGPTGTNVNDLYVLLRLAG